MNGTTPGSRPRPVLMIPLRRCGSHAIRLRLNFSPAFYSPYPLHIVDFMPTVPHYGDLADDETYFQLILDVVGLQNANMVRWEDVVLDPVAIFEHIKDEPRSVHRIVWEMLFEGGRKHGASVVMDKSLDSVHYAGELISLFDDMLFLNVVRDPRAQVSSMKRAIIHDFDSLLNAMTWVRAHDAARRLAQQYPRRVYTIRYEDFLVNQEAVLRGVCDFFDIEFLPEMLDVQRSAEASRLSGRSALWESNASAPIRANADKFRQALSEEEIRIIETLAADHMNYYGYERMTDSDAQIGEIDLDSVYVANEERRRLAWDALRFRDRRDYQLRRFRADYLSAVMARQVRKRDASPAVNPAGNLPAGRGARAGSDRPGAAARD